MPTDAAPSRRLPTILVVDDDEVSLAVICMMLDAEGYEVLRASGGEEALKKAAKLKRGNVPTLVLADLQMPGLSGHELAVAIRARLPHAVLVAMSASPGSLDGYDGFVGKPLNPAELRRLLARANGVTAHAADDPSSNAGAEVLDESVYFKLQRMMPAASLAEVYEVCIRDARQMAGRMVALADEDKVELRLVRRLAHTVKGGAGMLGAKMLAQAAAEVELGIYRKDDLPGLINKLLDSCDQLHRILITKMKAC
jgi:CheY-like chemotaxis protein